MRHLAQERHLHVGVCIVEVDGALQRAARHGYADPSGEVRLDVVAEVADSSESLCSAVAQPDASTVAIKTNKMRSMSGLPERTLSF
jgi:hypothetical protein